MALSKKSLVWVGTSKEDVSSFPKEAKSHIGHTLNEIECGVPMAELSDVKSFVTVGPGVYEITTHSGNNGLDHRTFFVAKFREAVYVLHAFEKRQQKTPTKEVTVARTRYNEVINERKKASKK
jgi:phage-related protein